MSGHRVRVRREVAGRRGKGVTTILDLPLDDAGMRELAGRLKKRCGVGGSAKNGIIELQGDHRDTVVEVLRADGYDLCSPAAEPSARSRPDLDADIIPASSWSRMWQWKTNFPVGDPVGHLDLDGHGILGVPGGSPTMSWSPHGAPAGRRRSWRKSSWWMWNGCHSEAVVDDPVFGRPQPRHASGLLRVEPSLLIVEASCPCRGRRC